MRVGTERSIITPSLTRRAPFPSPDLTYCHLNRRSNILFDNASPILFHMTAFYSSMKSSAAPTPVASIGRLWTPDPDNINRTALPIVNPPGKQVIIDYRVRRGNCDAISTGECPGLFQGDIVALSDGPGNGGSVSFIVGDRTVNAAVDEVARTLPKGVIRRAIVPKSFDLDRGTRAEYPKPEPPGTTYLEINIRKTSASNSVGVCEGGPNADSAARVATCLCNTGRTEPYGIFERDLDVIPGGRGPSTESY